MNTDLFGSNFYIEEFSVPQQNLRYWIVYDAGKRLSRLDRTNLKAQGWKLSRHTRTNKEIWIYTEYDK